eukprot:365795-Chlamydomonas_euryale.AAC.10
MSYMAEWAWEVRLRLRSNGWSGQAWEVRVCLWSEEWSGQACKLHVFCGVKHGVGGGMGEAGAKEGVARVRWCREVSARWPTRPELSLHHVRRQT